MAIRFASPSARVAAGALLCSLAAGAAGAPEEEGVSARPSDGGGRVMVVWSHPEDRAPATASATGVETAVPGSSVPASEAFRDPATGRFVEPAPDWLAADTGPQRLRLALSTSAEGLVEEPVAAPPGGVRVSLRGRFLSATFAEGRPDGTLAVGCGEPAASPLSAAAGPPAVLPPPAAPGGPR